MSTTVWSQRDWLEVPSPFKASFESIRLRVARLNDSGAAYDDLLSVRAQAYGLPPRATVATIDGYSELYCGYIEERPVVAFAATRAESGPVDCEEFYPASFMAAFRAKLTSTTRYCRVPDSNLKAQLASRFIGLVLRDQAELGVRAFIGNTQPHMLNYYSRMGYELISGHEFIHPRWKTRSLVLVASDLRKFHGLAPSNAELPDPVSREELARYVRFCELNGRRFPKNMTCACTRAPDAQCAFVSLVPSIPAAAE